MSKRDFVRAGIYEPHYHEHEMRMDHRGSLMFFDGNALINMACSRCEKERDVDLLLDRAIVQRDDKPNVSYLADNHVRAEMIRDTARSLGFEQSDITVHDVQPPIEGQRGFVRVETDGLIMEFVE
jgi:hypothetical protein